MAPPVLVEKWIFVHPPPWLVSLHYGLEVGPCGPNKHPPSHQTQPNSLPMIGQGVQITGQPPVLEDRVRTAPCPPPCPAAQGAVAGLSDCPVRDVLPDSPQCPGGKMDFCTSPSMTCFPALCVGSWSMWSQQTSPKSPDPTEQSTYDRTGGENHRTAPCPGGQGPDSPLSAALSGRTGGCRRPV